MTDGDVHTAVLRWVRERTELPVGRVIKGDQNGDALTTFPYIMVRFLGTAAVRTHAQDIEYADANEETVLARPIVETEWRFSVHSFGPGCTDLLRRLRTASHLAQALEPQLMPSLVVHELSQIRNIPEVIGEAWEQRAQMDLFVRGLVNDPVVIDVIEQFTVTVTSDRT